VTGRIGGGITTHDRREGYLQAVKHWNSRLGRGDVLVVVDDASEVPAPGATYRFDSQAGVARAKNKCLELLMAAGCEHLFLADDDCWPTADDWAARYISTGYRHLCYLWPDRVPQPRGCDARLLYDDGAVYARGWPRGVLLYVHRSVVDAIGGMRTDFPVWGGEHVEYSLRAWSAGLIPYPFMDACDSGAVIHACDEEGSHTRSVPSGVRRKALPQAMALIARYRGSVDYVEYRELPNVCVTILFTKVPDPQRDTRMAPEPGLVSSWRDSITGARAVILHDECDTDDPAWVKVPTGINPYLQRWISVAHWLQDTEARWVFMTDGTDVRMLHEPWEHMSDGALYIGYEPTTLGRSSWLARYHPPYRAWITGHRTLTLHNAGVVGGDLTTMREFTAAMCWEIANREHQVGIGDMGAFNYVTHRSPWAGRVVTGPQVVTRFKAYETEGSAWWAHK
jgi:hypothetical protein